MTIDKVKVAYELKKGKRRDLTPREWLLMDAMEYRSMISSGNLIYVSTSFTKVKADHIDAILGMRLVRAALWLSERIKGV